MLFWLWCCFCHVLWMLPSAVQLVEVQAKGPSEVILFMLPKYCFLRGINADCCSCASNKCVITWSQVIHNIVKINFTPEFIFRTSYLNGSVVQCIWTQRNTKNILPHLPISDMWCAVKEAEGTAWFQITGNSKDVLMPNRCTVSATPGVIAVIPLSNGCL